MARMKEDQSVAMVQQEHENASQSLREPLLDISDHSLVETNSHDENNDESQRLVDGMSVWTSVLLKSLYFLEALGSSAWGRYGTIYYNLHGLNSQQIGLMEGLMPAVRTVVQPLWGMFADRYECRKNVYLFTKVAGTTILMLLSLPVVYNSYAWILVVSFSTMLFASSGILDAYTLELLGETHKIRYGRYRMWSSISWGVGAIFMGYVTDHYGFEPNFIIYATLNGLSFALVAWRIPNVLAANEQDEGGSDEARDSLGEWTELFRLAKSPRVLIFAAENVVIGAGMGTVERLLFLYLINDLHASTLLCGLSVGVNVLFELPIFWYAKDLMAVLGGHDGMFTVAMVCFVVRVFSYTLLTPSTRWLILPLEAMHGLTFSCFWVAAMDIAKVLSHQVEGSSWNTTIPTVVQTLFSAVGVGLGAVLGGIVMNHCGSRTMYRGMASILLVTLIIHVAGSIISRCVYQRQLLPDHDEARREEEGRGQPDARREFHAAKSEDPESSILALPQTFSGEE